MKRILLSVLIVFFTMTVFAQNRNECEKIANSVFEAVGKKNIEQIKPYLSENFEIAGYKSPTAELVLEQLISNLGAVKSSSLLEAKNETGLRLTYDVEYEKFGKKQAFILFDENNKILTIELLKIEVKTVKTDNSNIEYNQSNVIEIPFVMMENLIVVKVSLNGEERDFILDSGSFLTIINSKYFNENVADSVKNQSSFSSLQGVTNESLTGTNVANMSLDFYGIRVNQKDMLTHDLSHLELDGKQIYGLIGYDMLSKYDILFDYDKMTVTLIKPDYFETFKNEKLAGKNI